MKKTLIVALFLASFLGFSQSNVELSSIDQDVNAATLVIKSTTENLSEGFTIEIGNYECDTMASEYLKNSIKYTSDQAGFERVADNQYTFTTPFSLDDLQSKWFKWRVTTAQGTSKWTCFSWSDYCDTFLDKNGDCK
ncbi:MAG TPA: hypothetical protein VLZ11_02010 [Flavobacterium sp.]|nr:hypothetical protein [Flavobacterium sp.]